MESIRIIVVEDHAIVREAVSVTIAKVDPAVRCEQCENAAQAIALLEADPSCDLLVVDLMLPEINGYSLLGVVSKRFPGVPALVLSALDDEESVRRAMKAGANGFMSKTSSSEEIVEGVRTVLAGGVVQPNHSRSTSGCSVRLRPKKAADFAARYNLTAAQSRVLDLLSQGLENKEIAEHLELTHGTVKVHVSAIFKAMGVSSRAQALLAMTRAGLHV